MVFLDKRARSARENFGVSRDFGQCTGENWSPVQGYDSNRLAGMRLYCIALGQGFHQAGHCPVATFPDYNQGITFFGERDLDA